jgi:type I restriction enzyme, R subunit
MAKKTYSKATETGTVQEPILKYVSSSYTSVSLGSNWGDVWTYLSRPDAEGLRGFDKSVTGNQERARNASLFFNEILYKKVVEFNKGYSDSQEELISKLNNQSPDIYGNREVLQFLRNKKTWINKVNAREQNLVLIDYDRPENNIYHVTEEYYYYNGRFGNRADVVFLINGIPILIIECKNATKDEAIAIGIQQLRRYHDETPIMMLPEQIFTAVDSLGFHYGVTWNMKIRSIFEWKSDDIGNLEAKVKEFCNPVTLLAFLKDYILFQEKDEKLDKFILKQHQTEAVETVIGRLLDGARSRGLVWHTQGSGKTFTIIVIAQKVYQQLEAEKPTILVLIDRNELEDQMVRNLEALNIENIVTVTSRVHLDRLLKDDYRGIAVCMLHKFDKTDKSLNDRKNIYVLIDEAHRTTQGDMGTYLMATVPNATLIGFTGTPIDKTAFGKGTFKTFNDPDNPDPKGYLHKYSMKESILDGTTKKLNYALAPNELLIPADRLEKEFLELAEVEGISDIHELNKILEKIGFKTFLKGEKRIDAIALYVAEHFKTNVDPMGYKALLVAVDREACALYKEALDKYLPAEWSRPVYTAHHNDGPLLKKYYLTEQDEKDLRKQFPKRDTLPKILIVTEKLLTGFDAPNLYAMYLDKPMRDHTLLQAIARVNRPYYDDVLALEKKYGLVIDFIGIFDKLEKALAFDSDEINAIVQNIDVLKKLFQEKMEVEGKIYLALLNGPFDDKMVTKLVQEFKEKGKRQELYKFYRQIEMLYEIISPDKFLLPFIEPYALISQIVSIVKKAFERRKGRGADREFLAKTEALVRKHTSIEAVKVIEKEVMLDADALQKLKENNSSDDIKIINLVKSIESVSSDDLENPNLISLREKARIALERYEDTQDTTKVIVNELIEDLEERLMKQKEQAALQFDNNVYFLFDKLREGGYQDPETIAKMARESFTAHPHWKTSEDETRQIRAKVYAAIFRSNSEADVDKVTQFVSEFFDFLKDQQS